MGVDNKNKFYILDPVIDTRIGKLYSIKVKDYDEFAKYNKLLILTKSGIFKMFSQYEDLINCLEQYSLYQIIKIFANYKYSHFIYDSFKKLFFLCFKKDVFDLIKNNDEFEKYRDLIMDVNCIHYEKPNPNPEIERFNQMRRLIQKSKGQEITFESMYTSVWVGIKECPDNLSMYRFNKLFERIAQFKNYDTSVIYNSVTGKIEPTLWYKDNTRKDNKKTLTEKELFSGKLNIGGK